jgi:uncharacterized protein YbjQ (UPF0145 family)
MLSIEPSPQPVPAHRTGTRNAEVVLMAMDLEELWRSASDDELIKARENFDSIREEAQGLILAELERRGLKVELWKCVNCGLENPKTLPRCRECGSDELGNEPVIEYQPVRPDRLVKCILCGKETGPLRGLPDHERFDYCLGCARREIKKILVSTTPALDGYRVKLYIDIESVEVVTVGGLMSEFSGSLADFFGARPTDFERKLQHARRVALDHLRLLALRARGNAVIGIDIDYADFSLNRVGVVATGTIVEVEKQPGATG